MTAEQLELLRGVEDAREVWQGLVAQHKAAIEAALAPSADGEFGYQRAKRAFVLVNEAYLRYRLSMVKFTEAVTRKPPS